MPLATFDTVRQPNGAEAVGATVMTEGFTTWESAALKLRDGDRDQDNTCLLYTSPSPRDRTRSRMPSSA